MKRIRCADPVVVNGRCETCDALTRAITHFVPTRGRRLFTMSAIADDGSTYVVRRWLTDPVGAWSHFARTTHYGVAAVLSGPTGRILFDTRWGRGAGTAVA